MSYEITHTNTFGTTAGSAELKTNENYAHILDRYGLSYNSNEFYLQVGAITQVQGWILHISVVSSQIYTVLDLLVPILISEHVAFKIPPDKQTAWDLLNGNLGLEHVGKSICLYPETFEVASRLAKQLIPLTRRFRGPAVLTDASLGGNVYTRYGSFNPILATDSTGKLCRYIYDADGQLIPDAYTIPFALPERVTWPFGELASLKPNGIKTTFNGKYKPIVLLKSDAKGNVYKSLYVKRLLQIRWCVVKEGKKDMWSDDMERDICDRLLWQHQLHKLFESTIPIPRILDLFTEDGNTYLVMTYINGESLVGKAYAQNRNCEIWYNLPSKSQYQILDYIIQIIVILEAFHSKGYVHRDVTPVNFIVDKRNKLFIIDNELAYSILDQKPIPPFELGTHGFMSPEQIDRKIPTIQQDIYGLGASIVALLTGLSPVTFDTKEHERLLNNLSFQIINKRFAETIASCLNPNPILRPSLKEIKNKIESYRDGLKTGTEQLDEKTDASAPDCTKLKEVIQESIKGFVMDPTIMEDGLWCSKVTDKTSALEKEQTGFIKRIGLGVGIAGTLYFLGRAQKAGYNISPCLYAYRKGWEYINDSFYSALPNVPTGLYVGAAGIAISMVAGFDSNLLEVNDQNKYLLRKCLELAPVSLDLANGLAGQGAALLQCREYLEEIFYEQVLTEYNQRLNAAQQKTGRWLSVSNNQGSGVNSEFEYGDAGITWFLLKQYATNNNVLVQNMLARALPGITKTSRLLKTIWRREGFRKLSNNNPTIVKSTFGHILTYLKAYEILKDQQFKILSEELLNEFPEMIAQDNFSQDSGLSGLGELYLEAYRILGNRRWLTRAEWIVQFLMHTYHDGVKNSKYWAGNNSTYPTADLLVGNSGIVHFLIRYLSSPGLKYRILE
jgi:serine/threonine protein kinase